MDYEARVATVTTDLGKRKEKEQYGQTEVRLEAMGSRSHASEGQVNDISINSTVHDDPNEMSPEMEEMKEKKCELHKSSECLQEITKIFKERIDDAGYTWTKKHFVWNLETETSVREAWDAKAFGRHADFLRDIKGSLLSTEAADLNRIKLFLCLLSP
ncbi:hypothetical protein Tco_1038108 [Tanacetum coccineum]